MSRAWHPVGADPSRVLSGDPAIAGRQALRVGHLGHRFEVLVSLLGDVERSGKLEYGTAVLDGDHASSCERPPVADAVHVVEDRCLGIAGVQEVGVQRMNRAPLNGASGRDQRLTGDLPAEDALTVVVG